MYNEHTSARLVLMFNSFTNRWGRAEEQRGKSSEKIPTRPGKKKKKKYTANSVKY